MKRRLLKTLVAVLAIAAAAAGPVRGQNASPDVTLDFTTNDWGLPTSNTMTTESYTDGTYSITLSATYAYKFTSGYLLLGKSGSYLELPEFESAVEKIEVVGNSAASGSVNQNIYVGGTAVSTQTTGAKGTNTYVINENYRAAGNIYTLKVENAYNTQITYIKVYYVSSGGGSGSETPTPGQNASGENIFQFCYDCQRNPAYPKTTASASLAGFENPLVGYKGIGFGMGNTSDGPWKLEYVGLWSTTDNHGINSVSTYQSTYSCTDVPVFRLYQWNATANEYQHAAYGVVCAYAKVSNAVEHTALFVAEGGWGCVLTNSSHSSSMNITFDEDLTTGITTLIPAPAVPHTVRFAEGMSGWQVQDVTASASAVAPAVLENVMAGDSLVVTAPATLPGKVKSVKAVKFVAPAATVTTAPTATAAYIAAGSTAALVNAGAANGGTMMYAVTTTNAQPASTADFSATIPTAEGRTAGTYYVWYYAKADADHSDSEIAGPVSVTLAEVITWNSTNVFNSAHSMEELHQWNPNPRTYEGITISVSGAGSSTFSAYDSQTQTGSLLCFGDEGDSFTFTAPSGKKFCKIEIINNGGFVFDEYGDWTMSEEEVNKAVWSGTAANEVTLGTVYTAASNLNSIVFTLIDAQ